MAAGLMVGKKSALGLALGVAAWAGAKWLGRRRPKTAAGVVMNAIPNVAAQVSLVEEKAIVPALAVPPGPSIPMAEERLPSVMIYQQPVEMPSCSTTADGMVWFALFNDGPQGMGRVAPPANAPGLGLAKIALPEKTGGGEVFNGGPLPESFFSEAPEAGNADEGKPSVNETAADATLVPMAPELPEAKQQPSAKESPAEQPVSPLPTFVLPKKRASGELPKTWFVPPAWNQFTLRPKADAGASSVHRSILPHEAMEQNQGRSRWPLVTAATVIVLAVVALAVFGAGLDGGFVNEWRQHWSHPQAATVTDDNDIGLWVKDTAKVAASPSSPR